MIAIAALIALLSFGTKFKANRDCLLTTAGFFSYMLARVLTSPAPYSARSDLYCILASLAVYGVTVFALDGTARRITLIVLLIFVGMVHVLAGVIQTGLGVNLAVTSFLQDLDHQTRATGLYANPDHLAGLLEVLGIFGLSLTCWSRRPGWIRVCLGYLTAICYLGAILTGSRAGYLSITVSLAVFAILSGLALWSAGMAPLIKFGGIGLALLASGLLAAGVMIQRDPMLRERTQQLFVDQGRLALWHAAIEQWKLAPILGTGGGTYRFYGRQFREPTMQGDPVVVHNDYLQLLCEYGLVAALGFLLFLFAHCRNAWRAFVHFGLERLAAGNLPSSDRLALIIATLCAIAAYVIHSGVDFNLHVPANALLVAFCFGIAANSGSNQTSAGRTSGTHLIPKFAAAAVAMVLLLQCIRLLPAENFTEEARVALGDEKPDLAASLARQALLSDRKNPNTFFYLGRALAASISNKPADERKASSYEPALSAFAEASQLSPLDGTYALDMAFIYDELGRFEEAESKFAIARARDPRSDVIEQLYRSHLEARANSGSARGNKP
ncbi:MAG: O-antigen ligase family protein [Chthoniobacterales bacterium]